MVNPGFFCFEDIRHIKCHYTYSVLVWRIWVLVDAVRNGPQPLA
jgi:hypothetical protein